MARVKKYEDFWVIEYDGRQEAMILVCDDGIEDTSVMYLTDYCATSSEL